MGSINLFYSLIYFIQKFNYKNSIRLVSIKIQSNSSSWINIFIHKKTKSYTFRQISKINFVNKI